MGVQSAELVVRLRREVDEVKDALNKQVEETVQQKAVEAAEIQDLNEVIRTLKEQNDKVHHAQCLRNTS